MAKSSRASTIKANNQRLKKQVFGPVESARTERLSAKLLELAAQPKPARVENDKAMEDAEDASTQQNTASAAKDGDAMDVDDGAKARKGKTTLGRKRIEKRRAKKSSIVFPKYNKGRQASRKKR